MTSSRSLYWLHAISPLHVGSGRGEGYIDLPLQREKATKFPLVPGTATKGVLRDYYGKTKPEKELEYAFGTTKQSGALTFTDARLICLPLASIYGTFAWCSSPLALRRLARDFRMAELTPPKEPKLLGAAEILVSPPVDQRKCLLISGDGKSNNAYLEDLELQTVATSEAEEWGRFIAENVFPQTDDPWRTEFRLRFAILNDNTFTFLCETATEVQAHICIDDEFKRVKRGALWYEEYLPAESILAGLAWSDNLGEPRDSQKRVETLNAYCPAGTEISLQIGGNATVGKGQVRCVFPASQPKEGAKS